VKLQNHLHTEGVAENPQGSQAGDGSAQLQLVAEPYPLCGREVFPLLKSSAIM